MKKVKVIDVRDCFSAYELERVINATIEGVGCSEHSHIDIRYIANEAGHVEWIFIEHHA